MFGTRYVRVAELSRQRAALDAEWLTAIADYDRSGDWATDGFANTASAVRSASRSTYGAARRTVDMARKLERLRETARALASGAISREHAQAITDAYTPEREDALVEIEGALVSAATMVDPRELRNNYVLYAVDAIDGDGGAAREESAYGRRGLHAGPVGDEYVMSANCGTATGDVIDAALNAEMERDRVRGDERSISQRRLDALANLCRRALDNEELGTRHGARPHVSAVVNVEELAGVTPDLVNELRTERRRHGHLSRATLERLLCDCEISRILTTTDGEILDVGRAHRTVTNTQWRALVARDGHCQAPGCDRPPDHCEAHHIHAWEHGGPTDMNNLQLLCWAHHRALHTATARARARERRAA